MKTLFSTYSNFFLHHLILHFYNILEAVSILKISTSKRDKFLIYKLNDRKYNGEPTYVFKTSSFKLQLMNDMNRHGNKILSTQYAHIDGKERRCSHFTTITLSVYHPTLLKQIRLATMECEGESAVNITKFWKLVNEALAEKFDDSVTFDPWGLMSDEAGAFWKSAIDNFHHEVIANSVSCEFHFKENVNKHSRALGKI